MELGFAVSVMLLKNHVFLFFKAYSMAMLGMEWKVGKTQSKKVPRFRKVKELPDPKLWNTEVTWTLQVCFFSVFFSCEMILECH